MSFRENSNQQLSFNDSLWGLTEREKKQATGRKKHSERFLKQLGVFVFVAIPLPMTGVWTGTAIAVFLGMKFKDAVLPIAAGNLVAGLIIELLAELCIAVWTIESLDYVLWGLFALAAVLFVITVVKMVTGKGAKAKDGDKDGDGQGSGKDVAGE